MEDVEIGEELVAAVDLAEAIEEPSEDLYVPELGRDRVEPAGRALDQAPGQPTLVPMDGAEAVRREETVQHVADTAVEADLEDLHDGFPRSVIRAGARKCQRQWGPKHDPRCGSSGCARHSSVGADAGIASRNGAP